MSASPTTFVGNVTADPELITVGNGSTKVTFSVACNHSWRKADGEWDESVSFFNVVAWRQLAEDAANVVQKGVRVIVTGRLDQRTWENDEGEKRSFIELVADDIAVSVKAIDGITRKQRDTDKSANGSRRPQPARQGPPRRAAAKVTVPDDEPF